MIWTKNVGHKGVELTRSFYFVPYSGNKQNTPCPKPYHFKNNGKPFFAADKNKNKRIENEKK
jgi:hypothetical protein